MTITNEQRTRNKWRADPGYFAREVLRLTLDEMQVKTAESVRDNPRTDLKGGNEIGKTFDAGVIGMWFLAAFGPRCTVVLTSSTDRQLSNQLWPEIEAMYNRAGPGLFGRIIDKHIEPDPSEAKWFMLGFATEREENFEGYHNDNILIIFDEPKGIKDGIWRGAERCLRGVGGTKRWLAIGTPPLAPLGEFCQISLDPRKAKLWNHLHLSAWDSPRVSKAACQESLETYGKDSPFYQSMVLGIIPTSSAESLVRLIDVEKAAGRSIDPGQPIQFGIDVADKGVDETVITRAEGLKITQYIHKGIDETVEIVRRYKELAKQCGKHPDDPGHPEHIDPKKIPVKIDDIGVGVGVTSTLRAEGYNAIPINVAWVAKDGDHYYDLGTEMFAELGKIFKDEDIDIPDDPVLKAQLYQRTQAEGKRKGGRIVTKLKSKEELRKTRGRGDKPSPDRADSLALCFCEPTRSNVFQFST